jgi:hypothetical protein
MARESAAEQDKIGKVLSMQIFMCKEMMRHMDQLCGVVDNMKDQVRG